MNWAFKVVIMDLCPGGPYRCGLPVNNLFTHKNKTQVIFTYLIKERQNFVLLDLFFLLVLKRKHNAPKIPQ